MIKKVMVLLLSLTMLLSITVGVYASVEETTLTTVTEIEASANSSQISPQKVDSSESITLSGGDTWKKKFDMNRWWPADPHDTFDVKVTNVKGSYKVLILGENGYFYESSTYTDQGVTVATSNAQPDTNYTVSVVNAKSNVELKATVAIKSYYK